MATLKIVLRKKINKDGTYPLALRITKDRKASYIGLGHAVKISEWDATGERVKKSHTNSARLNNLLLKKKAEANDTLIDLEAKNKDTSSKVIRKQIKPQGGASFFAQAKLFVDNLKKSGKYNRHTTDDSRIEIIREYVGGDLTFPEITVQFLENLRSDFKSTRGIKDRTITNYLILIRTIYNQAIKAGTADRRDYPFGRDKVTITLPDSIKVGLNTDEVKIIEGLKLTGYQDHARNVWLVAFYYAGMRISDVLRLKWSDFKDNRLQYAMSKNLKVDSLKTPDKVLRILEKYKDDPQKHDFIFPELKVLNELKPYEVQRKIGYATKRLGKELKKIVKNAGINKNISPHIARHSFAGIAGDKISIQALQQLYRHSKVTTTINYQGNFIHDKTDHALDTVLNF